MTREVVTKVLSLFNWNAQVQETKAKERREEERREESSKSLCIPLIGHVNI